MYVKLYTLLIQIDIIYTFYGYVYECIYHRPALPAPALDFDCAFSCISLL